MAAVAAVVMAAVMAAIMAAGGLANCKLICAGEDGRNGGRAHRPQPCGEAPGQYNLVSKAADVGCVSPCCVPPI